MITAIQQFHYQAFGLTIGSEIPLPELMPTNIRDSLPDVEIKFADLSEAWNEGVSAKTYFSVDGDDIRFAVPGTVLYRIRGGGEIAVHPLEGADERVVRLYLLGSCMGALLLQRGILPLHGSAVVIDGAAYAFVGESGAGKSTLAAAFAKRGYPLLSDDVIALALGSPDDGMDLPQPVVMPAYPQQKLWQESLEQLGMARDRYSPLYREVAKFAVPVPASYCGEQAPLKGIFELLPSASSTGVEIVPIGKLERLPLIGTHTYRNFLIPQLGLAAWHFALSARLATQTDVYRVSRPLHPFSAPEMVDRILQTVCEGVEAR